MTQHSSEQPTEYIITEKQLDRVERCYIDDCDGGCPNDYCPIDIGKQVRSRPYPAPAYDELQTANKMLEAEVDRLTGIETEAARKAREEVLDELIDELPNIERSYGGEQIDTYIETHELKEIIESLRSKEEQPR
jgi:hypothetical protein